MVWFFVIFASRVRFIEEGQEMNERSPEN